MATDIERQAYTLFYSSNSLGLRAGTIMYRLRFTDYGCANDDSRTTQTEHWSMTKNSNGDYPGISVPAYWLKEVPYKPHLIRVGGRWMCGPPRGVCGNVYYSDTPRAALEKWHRGLFAKTKSPSHESQHP